MGLSVPQNPAKPGREGWENTGKILKLLKLRSLEEPLGDGTQTSEEGCHLTGVGIPKAVQ